MTSSKFQKKPIPCVNISEIDVKNRLLTITKLGTLGRPAHAYRLYVRYTDFTMPKVVDALKMIDQRTQDEDIMVITNIYRYREFLTFPIEINQGSQHMG